MTGPFSRITANKSFQEDGSNCSIFSFDITTNRNRLPMARNAVRKLRTLRHPGVIKVLDTVEVWSLEILYIGVLTNIRTDRIIYLYCYWKSDSIEMAYQAEEHERWDAEMGTIQYSSEPLWSLRTLGSHLTVFTISKRSNSSMTMLPPSTAHFESVQYTQVRVENGRLADSKSSAVWRTTRQ